jgi:hypothetical protein
VSSFIASRQKEITSLLEKEVFISINKRNVSTDVRIFSSHFVNEIKHSSTEKAFEKLRLMIQTFNDQIKTLFWLSHQSFNALVNAWLSVSLSRFVNQWSYISETLFKRMCNRGSI